MGKTNRFQNIKIELIEEDLTPAQLVTIDENGLLRKSPATSSSGYGRVIDGGFAETVYLAHQNTEGGSANSITSRKINGGNA